MSPIVERPASMADYGVPETDDGLLPWSWAETRLTGSRNYWVTTVDRRGRPHAMPVWGVWLAADERFWFSCASTSAKARYLAANPNVVVAPGDTVEVVSLEGTARPAGDDVLDAVLDAYLAKYGEELRDPTHTDDQARDAMRAFFAENAGFVVEPRVAFGVIETPEDFGPRATRWRWA